MEPSSAQATLAHYWDDAADTLAGNQSTPVTTPIEPTEPSMLQTVLYGAAATVAVFWLGHWINVWRRTRREKAFNLELRRRHGIPDSDTRPFNVAYQAASIAARESTRKSQSVLPEVQQHQPSVRNVSLSNANIKEGFRPLARSRPPIPQFPGQSATRVPSGSFNFGYPVQQTSSLDSSRAYSQLPNTAVSASGSWGPRYAAENFRATSVPAVPTVSTRSAFAVAAASGSLRGSNTFTSTGSNDRRAWQNSSRPSTLSRATGNGQNRSRKRLYLTADEEAEEQAMVPNDKRSRTAAWGADAMIDGDNEPTWAQSYPVDPQPVAESNAPQTGKTKGKRPADDGEGDLRADGKRRQTKSSKQRSKQSDVPEKRGTKRERKEVDTASVLNDVMPVHKRGRAGDIDLSIVKEEEFDDEEDPTVSRNPLCGGRRIGQKWTSNGQEYMVGPNGDRLRLVTVKESRKKYFMPADSKHADNFHMVDVFVEKWLTEEQYAHAKTDGLLAWQENENLPTPIKQESPEKVLEVGKENQAGEEQPRVTAITLRARTANSVWNTPGQAPLTENDPYTNPFTAASAPQSPGPRRVKYTIGTVPAAALSASRMMSTWEKQEREAQALKMLRERKAAEAAAKAPPKPAPAPALVPSISLTSVVSTPVPSTPAPAAPEIKVIAATPGSSVSSRPLTTLAPPSDGKLSPFGFVPTPKPAGPATATATAPASAPNSFSFGAPKKEEPAKPVFSATPATEAPKTTTPSLFTPAAPTTSTNATSAPAPSLFGAPTATPTPAPAPTASLFGAPTSAPAPAAAAKPSPFAFGAPSTTSQPAAPATTTNTTASPFGTTSASTRFGSTPAPAPSPFGSAPAAPAAITKPSGGFTFGATPSAAPAASAPAPASTNMFSAQSTAKPASGGFSFGSGTSTTTDSSTAKPAGTFSFGTTPSNPTPASTGFGSTATGATSSGFGTGFGISNSTTNNGTAPSPFAFGAAPKPAAPAATTSGFGAQPAAPASNGFKFGTTNTTTNSTSGTNGTSNGFSFGAAAAKPTVSIPSTNAFGAPPTATPTTTGTPFTFGANASTAATNAAAAAASPATPSKPLFNMGAAPGASPVMGTRQISTSRRVQRAISKPPQ